MQRVDYQPFLIQDFLNWNNTEELDLRPWYQRRLTWNNPQRAYLINTLFEQKPVPSIYIRHSLDPEKEKSVREVVDGQQRLHCIISYVDDDFSARHPNHKRPVRYSQLTPQQREAFRMTSLSVGVLIGADDADVIEIFGRINSVLKTLNAQEKRNSKHSGEFKQFCLSQSAQRVSFWRDLEIFSAANISRMAEVQFTAELVINMMVGLSDYSSKQIDFFYSEYDEQFTNSEKIGLRLERVFSRIAELAPDTIRNTIFSRPPLFFSLFLLIDKNYGKLTRKVLTDGIYNVDEVFSSDPDLKTKNDIEFESALASNPHRIRSRRVRESYLKTIFRV